MTKSSPQQEIAALSSAKRGLTFLTANDWTLIADKAVRKQFNPGDALIKKGQPNHGIYILLHGSASVVIPPQMKKILIDTGEICGEISFLDDLPATITVVADEELETYFLDRATLQKLFELFPHLGSRFYHSLASGLARRLRELIDSPDPAGKS